jgi:aspartate kinase
VPDKPGTYQILGRDRRRHRCRRHQNRSKDGKTDFSFTVNLGDYAKTVDILTRIVPVRVLTL